MENNFAYYVFALVAVVVAFLVIKKVASCLIRTIVGVVVVAVLAYLYFSSKGMI
ncbi:MAG: hypothetical protein J6M40_03955 [Prevotella sp.]|jgi:presenilin-like A22 family membrane protease|nr:hypothetical protein [Prevotella sp.]